MRILLVEDEKELSNALSTILKKHKYSVDTAYDGQKGLNLALLNVYDLIILDIMLPEINGYEVLKQLRLKKISSPIIMLTALSSQEEKIKGLDLGADDYVTKPFSTEELLARIRAVTRRKGNYQNDELLTFKDLTLNLETYEISSNDKSVRLSSKEFDLLKFFLEKPEKIISKEIILDKIWGYNTELESNSIEVYMSFIRKKLSFIGSKVNIISTRNAGYRLE